MSTVTFASKAQNGPLVDRITLSSVAQSVLNGGINSFERYFNGVLLTKIEGLPEGTPVEMDLSNLASSGEGSASYLAGAINKAFGNGQLIDPSTGELVVPWDSYPNRVAWSSGNSLTLRFKKMQGPLVTMIFYGVVFLLVALELIHLMDSLFGANWVAKEVAAVVAPPSTGTPASSGPPAILVYGLVGIGLLVTGYAYYHIELARAGASRSEQYITVGGGG